MPDEDRLSGPERAVTRPSSKPPPVSVCIDWYAAGETQVVEVDGVQVLVRFVGRKGRRGRIAIHAPAGAVFRATERGAEDATG
jgi:hypothetical protein